MNHLRRSVTDREFLYDTKRDKWSNIRKERIMIIKSHKAFVTQARKEQHIKTEATYNTSRSTLRGRYLPRHPPIIP